MSVKFSLENFPLKNNADGNSATSNFVSSLVQSLPPIHDVAKMSGVELPDYLGSMTDESDES